MKGSRYAYRSHNHADRVGAPMSRRATAMSSRQAADEDAHDARIATRRLNQIASGEVALGAGDQLFRMLDMMFAQRNDSGGEPAIDSSHEIDQRLVAAQIDVASLDWVEFPANGARRAFKADGVNCIYLRWHDCVTIVWRDQIERPEPQDQDTELFCERHHRAQVCRLLRLAPAA